jgi:hypothetical protein
VAFLQAGGLPRGALVEFQTNVHTGKWGFEQDRMDDDDEAVLQPSYHAGSSLDGGIAWETCSASGSRSTQGSRSVVFFFRKYSTAIWLTGRGCEYLSAECCPGYPTTDSRVGGIPQSLLQHR